MLLTKAEYFARSKAKTLPNRCPILLRCERRKYTIEIMNKGAELKPDFVALKQPVVPIVGEGPYITSGNHNYIFGGMCPEVAMLEPNLFACGFTGSATTKAQHDKYTDPQDQLLETGHFSECAEYHLETSSTVKDTDYVVQKGSNQLTVHNNYNYSGNVQIGALAYEGNAISSRTMSVQYYNHPTLGRIIAELEKLDGAVNGANISEALKHETLAQIVQVRRDPSPGKLKKLIDKVRSLTALAEAGAALAPYAEALAAAAGFS